MSPRRSSRKSLIAKKIIISLLEERGKASNAEIRAHVKKKLGNMLPKTTDINTGELKQERISEHTYYKIMRTLVDEKILVKKKLLGEDMRQTVYILASK